MRRAGQNKVEEVEEVHKTKVLIIDHLIIIIFLCSQPDGGGIKCKAYLWNICMRTPLEKITSPLPFVYTSRECCHPSRQFTQCGGQC